MSLRRPHLLVAVALSALTLTSAAAAQTADDDFARGRALRAQHQDAEALAVFGALFARTHEPRALAQGSLAEGALGRWVDAEAHLVEALALPPDEWMRANRTLGANLESVLEQVRGHLGDLEVTSNVEGAEIWIGGRLANTLPSARPTRVVAGSVAFEVRARGHLSVARAVNVTPRGLARETIDLVSVPSTVTVTAVAVPARPVNTPLVTIAPAPVRRPAPASTGVRTGGWISAGVGVALLATGGITYALGSAAAARFNDDTLCLPAVGTRAEACASDQRTAETMLPVSVLGFVVGGVATASSVVLFMLSRPERREGAARAAVVCGPGPGTVGIGCAGTF